MAGAKVLIVEDDRIVGEDTQRRLKNLGFAVPSIVLSGEEAIEEVKREPSDLVLMDIILKGEMDGIETANQIRTKFDIPVVYVTAYLDEEVLQRAKLTGPFGYIIKPFEDKEISTTIEMALYKHKTEKKLKESEERYRRITEAVTDYIFTVQIEDGHPVETVHGPACVAVTGHTPEDFASDPYLWFRMVHEDDREAVREQARRVLSGQDVQPLEHRIFRKDGVMRWVKNTLVPHYDPEGRLVSYDGLISDTHERKRLEAQLQEAQKMEAIATLAGGVAHDFNNILGAIMGYTELAQLDAPKGSRFRASLTHVLKAANRAKDLVSQILAFSRQSEQEEKPIQLAPISKEALKLLRASIPKSIEIRKKIKKESGTVLADPTQIHQVLMNLCTNAAHAMLEKGGVLEVGLQDVNLDAGAAAEYRHLEPGLYVRLTVSDTGHGMTPEIVERIFDPYFTTKEKGVGTGLGLAVVHGIVKSHGGSIVVHSEPEKGTTFHVFLPTIQMEVSEETEPSDIPRGQNERILFVDDEEMLVEIGQHMLERLGYRVFSMTSPAEALEAFRGQPDKFDLVITDQTMPHMLGERLARETMSLRPNVPVILCTGFSERITDENTKGIGIRKVVTKPYSLRDLGTTVREVLDQS